ncbi:MAG: CxxxxCH/CxxCH domain c-type cytochrome, partial [Anaeromyxobacteraceae bacterium]
MATHPLLPACVTLALLSACAVGRDAGTLEAGPATVAAACTRCHGSGDDPAPPRSARGETSTTAIGVGAHQAHLKDGLLHRAIACAECHVLPTDIQHVDGVAKVAFGPNANAAGVTSSWSRASATCTTYCHGATLKGGTLTTPLWTGGSSQAACGSCHGAPPPAPHPQTADCGLCHQGYGRDFVNPVLHVDGKVQVSGGVASACGSCHGIPPPAPHPASTQCGSCHPGYTSTSVVAATHLNGVIDVSQSCTSCHGDAARTANPAAPPKDAKGNTATNARGVGAHQAHLSAVLSPPVACAECHLVPTSPSHATGVAEVTFGPLARSGGAAAAWNGTSLTCTSYCHGATLNAGGTATSPVWTRVDGAQKSCTSCHGAPPPAPHAQSSDCGSCHAGYTATTVNAATHVNGVVDVAGLTCTSCHGDGTRAASAPAPPRDTKGNTATTARGVGAHQAHLGSRLLAAPV